MFRGLRAVSFYDEPVLQLQPGLRRPVAKPVDRSLALSHSVGFLGGGGV